MKEDIIPESAVIIERDGDRIAVQSGFRDRDLIGEVPGASWDRNERIWRTRLSWAACVQLRAIFGERLQIGPALQQWALEERARRIDPCLWLREAHELVPEWEQALNLQNAELYPLQKVGVAFITMAQYCIVGDEVGAGKTRQVIQALEKRDAYPAIIVATKSAKESWRREFEQVAPHRKVVVVGGSAKKRREQLASGADVFIVHWQLVRFHSKLSGYGYIKLSDDEKEPKELNAIGAKAVVADEAHRMQDPKSKQTRAVWALMDAVPTAADTYRICMTGTPLSKAIDSFWPLLRGVAPHEFPQKTKFIDRYAMQTWSPFGFTEITGILPERRQEFFSIVDPLFIRRPTKMVVPYLPAPIRMPPRYVELTGKQKKAYEQFRDELLAEIEGGVLLTKNPLTQMARLRQAAAATLALDENRNVTLQEPSVVLDELEDVLEELGTKQALIFSESRQLMELCAARLTKHDRDIGLITGMIGEADRQKAQDDFNAGKLQYLGLTVGAGGESLTLTAADAMIFIERSFSMIANKQAEGRAVRPGQTSRVLIIDIVPYLGEDTKTGERIPTIAEHTYEILIEKGMNLEELVRDGDTLKKWLSKKGK